MRPITSRFLQVSCLCLTVMCGLPVHGDSLPVPAPNLNLSVQEVRERHPPHAAFCARTPEFCDLSGPTSVAYTASIAQALKSVNATANARLLCEQSDMELFGTEEFWTYPFDGAGDCEDAAIFKREELVVLGVPRGAMTLAIVHHKIRLNAHAVLLVETSAGTFLLNSVRDDVLIWHEAPYNFEARERPDGRWDRYDQGAWDFE